MLCPSHRCSHHFRAWPRRGPVPGSSGQLVRHTPVGGDLALGGWCPVGCNEALQTPPFSLCVLAEVPKELPGKDISHFLTT